MTSSFLNTDSEMRPDSLYYQNNKHSLGLSYDEFVRLRKFEHWYVSTIETVFLDQPFKITSPYWFLHSVEEIFIQEVYRFETTNPQPIIVDCGANWGLSIIYFKSKFPRSIILAYEADLNIYKIASDNLSAFNFTNVALHNSAVWDRDGNLMFSSEGGVGGSVAALPVDANEENFESAPEGSWVGNYNTYFGVHKRTKIKVKAFRLKNLLRRYSLIDFLKVDIEGAEYNVIMDCARELRRVDKMFIEYHSTPGHPQTLDEILKVIRKSGFRYYIKEASNNYVHPFIRDKDVFYDLQLNIFCFRKHL